MTLSGFGKEEILRTLAWRPIVVAAMASVATIASAAHFSHSDDDALLFVARSLPTPVSWLGSHTKNVNAAGTGSGSATVFYRNHDIMKSPTCVWVFLLNFSRRLHSGQQVFAGTWMDKFDVEDMDIYYNMPQRMLADCKFLTDCAPRVKCENVSALLFAQKNVSDGVWFRKCWSDNSDDSDDDSDDIFDESSDNETCIDGKDPHILNTKWIKAILNTGINYGLLKLLADAIVYPALKVSVVLSYTAPKYFQVVRIDGNSNLSDIIGKELSIKSQATGLCLLAQLFTCKEKITKCACLSTNSLTDTSQIAKVYGGGGSPSSSSFIIQMDEYNHLISGAYSQNTQ
ncbi:hypothetical protein Tco_0760768, partial [Tanacetum coccineum]